MPNVLLDGRFDVVIVDYSIATKSNVDAVITGFDESIHPVRSKHVHDNAVRSEWSIYCERVDNVVVWLTKNITRVICDACVLGRLDP